MQLILCNIEFEHIHLGRELITSLVINLFALMILQDILSGNKIILRSDNLFHVTTSLILCSARECFQSQSGERINNSTYKSEHDTVFNRLVTASCLFPFSFFFVER